MKNTCVACATLPLLQEFPNIKSLKLKGKPRAASYGPEPGLLPDNWGGSVEQINGNFAHLNSSHFRRMQFKVAGRGQTLSSLKLHAASKLQSLRYFWAENFKEWPSGRDLLVLAPPPKYLNIELRPYSEKVGEDEQSKLCVVDKRTAQILVYHSLAGLRADCPVEAHRI